FLRRIRYSGADGERLAPLIVGPGPPGVSVKPRGDGLAGMADLAGLEGWIAAILGVVVVAILGLQHLRRRSPARPTYSGTPPDCMAPDDPATPGPKTDVGEIGS